MPLMCLYRKIPSVLILQQLIVLQRKVRGRVQVTRTAIACSLSSFIAGARRSSRPWCSSGQRHLCAGIAPGFAATGGAGNPAPREAGHQSKRPTGT
jgi:hypothetical protein